MDIPECLTKADLKRANRELDTIFGRLSQAVRMAGALKNVEMAACAVLCNRMARDDKMLRRLMKEYDLLAMVSALLKVKCDLCKAAALHLAVSISQSSAKDTETMLRIGTTVLPPLVEAVKGREKDDVFSESAGMFLFNYLLGMLCVEDEERRRALLDGLLRFASLIGRCGPGLVTYIVFIWSMAAIEGPQFSAGRDRPFFDFLVGILRIGGPLNRLYALKGLYLHRRPGRPSIAFTDHSHPVPFDLDAVLAVGKRLPILRDSADHPDQQDFMIAHSAIVNAFGTFYKSAPAERDFGRVAVGIALGLLEDPLVFSLDGNIPARYGLPSGSPRASDIPLDDWKNILMHSADVLSTMTPRAIKAAGAACVLRPRETFVATRQDLGDVLRAADLLLRTDFPGAARIALPAYRRTRDTQCKAWFLYALSWHGQHRPDINLVYETIVSWFRRTAPDAPPPDVLGSAACKMAVRNLGLYSLGMTLCGMKEDDARSPTGMSLRTKDVIVARGAAMLYLDLCVKDDRDGHTMVALRILTKLLFDGPTLGTSFMDPEMADLLKLYEDHKRSARMNWCDARRSYLAAAVDKFAEHRVSGWRMFGGAGLTFHESLPWPVWGELPEFHSCFAPVTPRGIGSLTKLVHECQAQPVTWTSLPTEVFTTIVTGHPDQLNLHQCAACKAYSASLKRCSSCRNVRYCGRECQRSHWRSGHRYECTRAFL